MSEFWLISAPGEPTCRATWEKINHATVHAHELATNYRFDLPDFHVGTLDQLMGLTDELAKFDSVVEALIHRIVHYLRDILNDDESRRNKIDELLRVNNATNVITYVTHFQWDYAKYPIKLSLPEITTLISKQAVQIEADLKQRSTTFNALRGNLASCERKSQGSLLTKSLAEVVKKEHFVLDSEYLTTLVVVVPKADYKQWENKYENLSEMVVPRSSKLVAQDDDFGLFSVTLFQKVVDTFKQKAREYKFIVRDFVYNEVELEAGRSALTALATAKMRQEAPLIRWLQVNFSETLIAWMHIKAVRVFVESVLRYSLPVNFQPILMLPKSKSSIKRLRHVLNNLFAHLDAPNNNNNNTATGSASRGDLDLGFDAASLGLNMPSDYFPYVCLVVNTDFLSATKPTASGSSSSSGALLHS